MPRRNESSLPYVYGSRGASGGPVGLCDYGHGLRWPSRRVNKLEDIQYDAVEK
jgi:hypothetical protein